MAKITTPLEVYKLLPKTNCGQCGIATCMAFAAAIIKKEKRPVDCPFLGREAAERMDSSVETPVSLESVQEASLKDLQSRISRIDLSVRAAALGGRVHGGRLIVPCLGKDFEIDEAGNVVSQCHTHAWFAVPLLDYVLSCRAEPVPERWVPFRELDCGKTWGPLFERRCESPFKEIADAHSELFADLISMFSGVSSHRPFASDIAVVLYPLPKVPLLVCYWKPDGDLESRLHLFFDDTAEQRLRIESLFTLGTGLVRMLEKIMSRHTDKGITLSRWPAAESYISQKKGRTGG